MKKYLLLFIVVLVPSLFIMGCSGTDDLLTTKQNVDVELDSFQLTYNPGGAAPLAAAATGDNPSCGTVNLSSLLATNPEWEDLADRLRDVKIDEVRYMVTSNSTSVPITGTLSLTNPADTASLALIGQFDLDAFETVLSWTALPFAENGANIVNHYLSNRDVSFDYCAEGSPNETDLSLTLAIQLGVEVTVKIL